MKKNYIFKLDQKETVCFASSLYIGLTFICKACQKILFDFLDIEFATFTTQHLYFFTTIV